MNKLQQKIRDPLFWPCMILMGVLVGWMLYLAPGNWQEFQKREKEFEEKQALDEKGKSYRDMIDHADEMLARKDKMPSPSYPYIHKAYAYVHLQDFQSAMANFEHAKEVDPLGYWKGNATDLAPSLAERNEYDRAIKVFEDLVGNFPSVPGVRTSYGRFLYSTKQGDLRNPARAVQLLKKNAEEREASSFDHEILAEALAANEEFEAAVKECDIAVPLLKKEWADRKAQMEKRIAQVRAMKDTEGWLKREEENLAALTKSHETHLQRLAAIRALFLERRALPPSKRY